MGTDEIESVYFQKESFMGTITTGERGEEKDTVLNSSRNLELVSDSNSDDEDENETPGRS